jgi:hypothetical protein
VWPATHITLAGQANVSAFPEEAVLKVYDCFRDLEFSGIDRILPLIHKGFLQNSQANDETTQKEQSF